MAQQAITIKFRTPTATRGARVSVSSYAGAREYAYGHALSLDENATAAVRAFMNDMGWQGDFVIASQCSSTYVAILIPDRYIKARDAVIAVRKAITSGEISWVDPHASEWGQAITELTDGTQKGGFSCEYARSI